MSTPAKQITAAVAVALSVWALFGLLAGVITAAIGLVVVLILNREGRDTGVVTPQSRDGIPAAFPGSRAVWTCPGCRELAGVLVPEGTPAGTQAAACACGTEVKVEVRDRECPKGHMIGAHGRCIHCGYTPQLATSGSDR